jgi:hypothetical protein
LNGWAAGSFSRRAKLHVSVYTVQSVSAKWVSPWRYTLSARLLYEVKPWGICGGRSGSGACPHSVLLVTSSYTKNRGSAVCIVTCYGLHGLGAGVRVPVVKNFQFSTWSRPALGPTQPPIQCVPEAFFPWVKRQGREADHSPLTSVDIKKTWICTSTPPYVFMAQCLVS